VNWYVKVYVDCDKDLSQVIDQIARITSGSVRMRSVSSKQLEIYIVAIGDFNESCRSQPDDGFLYYRFYLDIEPASAIARDQFVVSLGNLLEALWSFGWKAIAACDFEEELPRSGGYLGREG